MGRRIPLANDPYVQPSALSFSLLLAGIGAAIAISATTTLCIARFRRRSKQKPSIMSPPPNEIAESLGASPSAPLPTTLITTSETLIMPRLSAVESEGGRKEDDDDASIQIKELPLPPARQLRETDSCNNCMTESASTRSLRNPSTRSLRKTMSTQMRKSLSLVGMKRESGEDDRSNHTKKKGKTRNEDSIWKKTIILGEKCKVPEDDDDEDVINVHDGKGNRILTYHPRTPSSISSFSRQNSCIDDRINAISFLDRDKRKTRKEEEEFS